MTGRVTGNREAIVMPNRARFLSHAQSKLRLCSANHRAGYFSNLACDWLSIVWAYSEQKTKKRTLMLYLGSLSSWWKYIQIPVQTGWDKGLSVPLLSKSRGQEGFSNSLWPSDAIWGHGPRSALAQVMACCLMAPSHCLNQRWLISGKFQRHTN